jgi:Na+-translocating ferredoxin:NAD+ oxidoreductase RNF subunit RnfB
MEQNVFRALQERLDMYSIGFPATESGIELEILRRLFSKDDAVLFMELSPMLELPESVAQRTGKSVSEVLANLEDMASRGLLFRQKKGETVRYGAIPFMHGLMEFQIKRVDREFVELLERYFSAGFSKAIAKSAESFLRTIPVQEAIEAGQHVAPFEDAREILRNVKTIVVTDCLCRKGKDLVGEGCDRPLEACFMFGSMAQYYLDYGMGRQVTVEEAIKILEKCRDTGLVTQPATAQNPSGMCNCCGDCCGILKSIKEMPHPAEYVFTNYFASVEEGQCTGCEACIDRCQMEALRINDFNMVKVLPDRCIGCGLCITACPAGALVLVRKVEGQYRTPPSTSAEQMMIMAQKRGIQF